MSKKLIERARNAKTSIGASLHFGLCAELADCVEKLEAKNDKLEQQLAEFKHGQDTYQQLFNKLADSQKQVTLLRSVMNRIAFSRTGQCIDLAQELFAREEWAAEALDATEPKP